MDSKSVNKNQILSKEKLAEIRNRVLTAIYEYANEFKSYQSLKVPYLTLLNKQEGVTRDTITDICTGAANEFACFNFIKLGSENILVEDINITALKNTLLSQPTNQIKFGDLLIDKENAQISFKSKSAALQLNNNFAKFLILFFENPGKLFSHKELNSYFFPISLEKKDPTEVTRKVKAKALLILSEIGIPKTLIDESFISIRNEGYKFNPQPLTTHK